MILKDEACRRKAANDKNEKRPDRHGYSSFVKIKLKVRQATAR